MKYRVGLFLLVLFLGSACSLLTGKVAQSPTETVSPTSTYTLQAPADTPPVPFTTATPSAAVSTPESGSTLPPLPFASPTALALPTQVETIAPTVTPGGPPTQTPKAEEPSSLLDQYLPRREKVAETEHFVFYAQDGYFPVDQGWLTAQAEEVYAYVSQRLDGSQVKHKIQLAFQPPDKQACPVRGLASQGEAPMIIIFADQNSALDYLLGVLAHEVGHAITYEGFPGGLPGNLALAEGIASWGSGKYWAAWKKVDSIDDLVRGYLKDGKYQPLYENVELRGVYPWQGNTSKGEDCLARRDQLYTEWASFTGYLIETYGWEKAYRLFRLPDPQEQDGERILFPPDYAGIYGKALNQLEWEWVGVLTRR